MKNLACLSLLILSVFCLASRGEERAYSEEKLKAVADLPQWRLLLHYKKDWKPGDSSEIDGGDFFISPQGRKNPLAELKASLSVLNSDRVFGPLKQPAVCAFRARYHFLSERLGFKIPSRVCEKWDGFMSRFINPSSVSLVFSSAYTNNPASMFGHLFFKVNSSHSSDLLDTGVNFAAQVSPDEHPLAFFYFGVFGGYEGHWSVQPYYEKINEYSRAENRDLWEYELNLTPQETQFFLEHLWELETTAKIDYYFFDDNCAYQMGRIIEAVKPEWTLSDHTIYVIPGELVKNFFNDPQVVRSVHFRPALRKRLLQKYQVLKGDQKDQFFSLIKNTVPAHQISDVLVLETGSSYIDYQRQMKKGQLDESEIKLWNEILIQRASLGKAKLPELPAITGDTRPDLGHDAYALIPSLGSEFQADGVGHSYLGFKIKSAYHDLMGRDLGFKKYSEIQFPWLEVRYRPDADQWHLEELGGLRIVSLTPLSQIDFHPSWKLSTAFLSPKDFGCLNCRHFIWEGGIGLSEEILSEDHIVYQFLTMKAEADEKLPQGHRLLPTLEAGWISSYADLWKIGLQSSYSKDIGATRIHNEIFRLALSQSYFPSRNIDIRQKLEWIYPSLGERPAYAEIRLDLSFYFR